MANEKIENLLNLALEATRREREKSLELSVGFDAVQRTWEVIIKYGGTTEELKELLQKNFPAYFDEILFTNLRNEYAILVLPESIVDAVAGLAEVEYMEKPKRLFFAVNEGKRVSCITPLQEPIGTGVIGGVGSTLGGGTASGGGAAVSGGLSGVNVLMGVIDSGIDYAHPDFRNADSTTRILNLWNQTTLNLLTE